MNLVMLSKQQSDRKTYIYSVPATAIFIVTGFRYSCQTSTIVKAGGDVERESTEALRNQYP